MGLSRLRTGTTRTGVTLTHILRILGVLVSRRDSEIVVEYPSLVPLRLPRLRKGNTWLEYDPFLLTDFERIREDLFVAVLDCIFVK
jgi:hypothetical protein